MRTLLLVFVCISTVWGGTLDYDDYEPDGKSLTSANKTAAIDVRGHRPVQRGREVYSPVRYAPPTVNSANRYRGRPSTPQVTQGQVQEREEQPDVGGCSHASEELGVLCPNGCELKTALLKQERSVRTSLAELRPQLDALARSSNSIFSYVSSVSSSLRERQRVISDNSATVSHYTDSVEEQHAFIKDTVDTVFPSNIRILQGVLDQVRQKIQRLEKAVQAQTEDCREPCRTSCPIPVVSGTECEDIFRRGGTTSQMYLVRPDAAAPPFRVFCDQTTQNGGWLLIQSRLDGSVDFGRRWDQYRRGFGNVAFDSGKGFCDTPGELWLGNERISQLTRMGSTEVLVQMQDWTGAKVHAQYQKFTVQSDASNYVLAVDGYSGNAGNSFMDGASDLFGENRTMTVHNGMMFSTYDRDNDNWTPGDHSKQCSREDGGGWWYNRCHSSNPNGRYYVGGDYTKRMAKHGTDDGVVWMNWKGSWYSLKTISMKIRPFFTS